MDTSQRRRSSRLRKLQAERDASDHSIQGTSKSNANLSTGSRVSQNIGRRRVRSSSETFTSQNTAKRRKRTASTKSKLSVSTDSNQSTKITRRRRGRSVSKENQAKNVTPSPVPCTTGTKYFFSSSRKKTHGRLRKSIVLNENDDSKSKVPPGVVNIYRCWHAECSSPVPACGKRQSLTRKEGKQRIHQKPRRYPSMLTWGGSFTNFCSPESVTIDYIRSYGEDYWQSLHDSERPIIYDPSTINLSNELEQYRPNTETPNGNRKGKRVINNPLGSPPSRRSSRSSLSSTSTFGESEVTPENINPRKQVPEGDCVATDFNCIEQKRNPQPHQSLENTKAMTIQPQLTPKMRSILVDWLIELSEHFSFGPSTLHLAVTLVDRVLARGRFLEQPTSNSISHGTESRCTRSRSLAAMTTNTDSSIYDSDSSFNESDDESDDEKTHDTRCYIIPRDRFQLLGATCVWLACKVLEKTPPKARDIAYVSDHIYSVEQITRMERRICNALNFSFFEAPTPHHFLFEFIRASSAGCAPEQQEDKLSNENNIYPNACALQVAATGVGLATNSIFRDMVHYLLELGRLPYGPTGRNPSLLAAAAVYLARVTLGIPRALKNATEPGAAVPSSQYLEDLIDSDSRSDSSFYYWTPTLKYYTGYTQNDLKETVMEIHEYHMAAESSALKAVFNKYKSKHYHRVALKTVVRVEDLGF